MQRRRLEYRYFTYIFFQSQIKFHSEYQLDYFFPVTYTQIGIKAENKGVCMFSLGIDSGSTMTKGVLFDGNDVVGCHMLPTSMRPGEIVRDIYDRLYTEDTGFVVSTGYGRELLKEADAKITEITCHGAGASYLAPGCDTVIDIGGQDCKVITLDSHGQVNDFLMNDKCAAGTGRFFESMANAFEMSLEEFSKLSLTAENVIPITAQCTVFAESEVITLVGEGKPQNEIAAGIQQAVAKRCFVMAKKAGAKDAITLTGGCAKNQGLKAAIEKVLRMKVIELKIDPQLMGALGAAEYARQKGLDL